MQAGDLAIVMCANRTSGTWSVGVDGGQSWTQVVLNTGQRIFWCRFNGTWGADPRFDCTSTACTSAVMLVYRGGGSTFLWAVDVALSYGSANVGSAPYTVTRTGLTTVGADVVALAGWHNLGATTFGSLSGTGWTVSGDAQYRNTAGSDQSLSFAHYIAGSPATATGDVSKNSSSNFLGAVWIIAFVNFEPKAALAMNYYRRRRTT